jgi:hypothetical protein
MTSSRQRLLVAVVYLAYMGAYIVITGDEPGDDNGDKGMATDIAAAFFAVLVIALHVAVGVLTRTWLAVLLPVVALLFAIPFGSPEEYVEPDVPIWWWYALFGVPPAAFLVFIGVVLGKVLYARRLRGA